MEEISETVWVVWQKEKQSSKLQQIPKTFYDDVIEYLSKTPPTESQKTTQENTQRLLTNIHERRKQKLMAYLAYNQQPPQPLPPKEEALLTSLQSVLEEDKIFKTNKTQMVVTQEIPKIILPSGNELGPLSKNQIITTQNKKDEEFLISNNLCKLE